MMPEPFPVPAEELEIKPMKPDSNILSDKEAKKEPKWMGKQRKKRYFSRFFKFFGEKSRLINVVFFNLDNISALLTNAFSFFTLFTIIVAVYFSLEHLRLGNYLAVYAGGFLIIVLAALNHFSGKTE